MFRLAQQLNELLLKNAFGYVRVTVLPVISENWELTLNAMVMVTEDPVETVAFIDGPMMGIPIEIGADGIP